MRRPIALALAATSAVFLVMASTASAGFVFKLPAGAVIYKIVGEKTIVEIENNGLVAETPSFNELQRNNLVGGKQHIGVNKAKTLKECEIGIAVGGKCSVEVEYKIERKAAEPIAEFRLVVEPPAFTLSPNFSA